MVGSHVNVLYTFVESVIDLKSEKYFMITSIVHLYTCTSQGQHMHRWQKGIDSVTANQHLSKCS